MIAPVPAAGAAVMAEGRQWRALQPHWKRSAAAGGAVWLSVRGQHPYQGPTVTALLVVVPLLVVNLVATLAVARRRTTGVSGRSRLRPAEITVMVVIWVGVFVVMGALAGAG